MIDTMQAISCERLISSLPMEIMAHILSYCKWRDSLVVCRDWYHLTTKSREYRRCYKAMSAPLSIQSRTNLTIIHIKKLQSILRDALCDVADSIAIYASEASSIVYDITLRDVRIEIHCRVTTTSDAYTCPSVTVIRKHYGATFMNYDLFMCGEWIVRKRALYLKLINRLHKLNIGRVESLAFS